MNARGMPEEYCCIIRLCDDGLLVVVVDSAER